MATLSDPELFRQALESFHSGVYFVDTERRIIYWSCGAERITGFLRHEVIGRACGCSILSHCDEKGTVLCGTHCLLSAAMLDGKTRQARLYLKHKDGHRVRVHIWAAPLRDDLGNITGAVESFEEVFVPRSPNRRVRDLWAHGCLDERTGVYSRGFLEFHLRENLAAFKEYGLPFSVLIFATQQLTGFAAKYGREAADGILRSLAESLQNFFRSIDVVGRWTEECFLAILPSCSAGDCQRLAERTRQVIAQTRIEWWGDSLQIDMRYGIATISQQDTLDSLLERASYNLLRNDCAPSANQQEGTAQG